MRLDLIKAAFVVLYDLSFTGKHSAITPAVESTIASLRRSISFSRKEAQMLLDIELSVLGEPFSAALVLAYEGIGAQRVEPDYTFTSRDIEMLIMVRASARISNKRAVEILQKERLVAPPTLNS